MKKILSAYFCGTQFSITPDEDNKALLACSLFTRTQEDDSHIKMGFNGCFIDFGWRGGIFGSGLDKQAAEVIDCVLAEINAGNEITLNIYGHSRGAIAGLLLAKQLSNIDPNKLTINIAMLDPVPGNFIITSRLDPFNITLTNKTKDLSQCKPLKNVLVIYPYRPLPAYMCHAPLLVSYPSEAHVELEITSGCHAGREWVGDYNSRDLVLHRVQAFMIQHGTKLLPMEPSKNVAFSDDDIEPEDYENIETLNKKYKSIYATIEMRRVYETTSRPTHSNDVLSITSEQEASRYLNERHRDLEKGNAQDPVCLSIQPQPGLFAKLSRFFLKHPLMGQIIKWSLISLSISTALYFTGGLAAIPFVGALTLKLGTLSLLAFSPIVCASIATFWYGSAKPFLSWCAEKIFYPHYAMRKLKPVDPVIGNSTKKALESFGQGKSASLHPENVDENDINDSSVTSSKVDMMPPSCSNDATYSSTLGCTS